MTPEERERLRRAFAAGFMATGEGWNGEVPFNRAHVNNWLREKADRWVDQSYPAAPMHHPV
jgi:hypothetical protein